MPDLNEFFGMLRRDRRSSSWSRAQSIDQAIRNLLNEVGEVEEAIGRDDRDDLVGELGDVLWTTLFLIIVAEDEGIAPADETISRAMEKLRRRKPWIFEGRTMSISDEVRCWEEAKRKERP